MEFPPAGLERPILSLSRGTPHFTPGPLTVLLVMSLCDPGRLLSSDLFACYRTCIVPFPPEYPPNSDFSVKSMFSRSRIEENHPRAFFPVGFLLKFSFFFLFFFYELHGIDYATRRFFFPPLDEFPPSSAAMPDHSLLYSLITCR